MQIPNRYTHRHNIKLGLTLFKSPLPPQVREQLASSDELHHKEDFIIGLKHILHPHQKWMMSFHENFLF